MRYTASTAACGFAQAPLPLARSRKRRYQAPTASHNFASPNPPASNS